MKVRQAELRDLPELKAMFIKLIDFVKGCGQWALSENTADVENGVVGFILSKMGTEGSIALVSVGEDDRPNGFLLGWILDYPMFYQHRRIAELQFLYPLSFDRSPHLLKKFEDWGRAMGATATSNYATPGNEASIKVMKRDGRQLAYHHFFKPYEVKHEELS